jgi:hypothetical protein
MTVNKDAQTKHAGKNFMKATTIKAIPAEIPAPKIRSAQFLIIMN